MEMICPYFNSLREKRTLNWISSTQFLQAHAGPLWEQYIIKRRLSTLNRGHDSQENTVKDWIELSSELGLYTERPRFVNGAPNLHSEKN